MSGHPIAVAMGRLVPSTRYRHPGDVIRLIAGSILLLVSLVATSGASFPSGHAIAASVTVVAAVIALTPPGRRRVAWGAAAVGFMPRVLLVDHVRSTEGLALCGRGAACPG